MDSMTLSLAHWDLMNFVNPDQIRMPSFNLSILWVLPFKAIILFIPEIVDTLVI